ncbi:MAG: T9SS type A sorting domain-containing protein, partial [Bacteroidia bacterium]
KYWQNGIRLEACASSKVLYNSVENIGRGLFFGGTCTGTQTAKNHMLNNMDGWLLNYGTTGYQLGTASACISSENKWEGIFTNHLYSYYSNGSTSLHNLYGPLTSTSTSGGSMNPIGLISSVYPLTGYSAIPTAPCSVLSGYKLSAESSLEQWQVIADDQDNYPIYSESARWMNKNALYTMIMSDPSLKTSPGLKNFAGTIAGSNMEKLYRLNDQIIQGGNDLQQVKEILNEVTPSTLVEQNLKSVFEILISRNTGNTTSAKETSTLQEIARQCPYEGGPGVYNARVMLSMTEETVYVNECELALPNRMADLNSNTRSEQNISVVPNPSNGSFIVSLSGDNSKDIYIYDVMGKIVFMKKATQEKNITIDLSSLPKGMFVVKVVCGSSVNTQRIITQ